MKGNLLIRFWVVIGILTLARDASGARSVDEQVKMLAERYRQVEDQLPRSIRYTSKDESGGATTARQEWYNGAGELIKVAVERNDASGASSQNTSRTIWIVTLAGEGCSCL